MPIYEYRCKECGCRFEELVIAGREPAKCPQCGHKRVERQMSVFSSAAPTSGVGAAGGGGSCGSGGFS